jgi:hypothetical protein
VDKSNHNNKVFWVSSIIVALFVLWGAFSLVRNATKVFDVTTYVFGWFYLLSVISIKIKNFSKRNQKKNDGKFSTLMDIIGNWSPILGTWAMQRRSLADHVKATAKFAVGQLLLASKTTS